MEIFKYLFITIVFCFSIFQANATNVTHDERAIIIDGVRRVLISGSIHYPRSTAEMWPKLVRRSKEGGLDTIETYVFWDAHEPVRRQYNFEGNLDIVRFIKTVQDQGLYVVLRIGPYVCAEWNYGAIPMWVHNLPGVAIRTNNSVFKDEMQTFTTLIVNKMKEANLFASQGGPIILSQIENEYGNVMYSYGANGQAYIDWCAQMADSLNIGVPWIMCQQQNAPNPMLETCNGFYCDQFSPTDKNTPKMWTENWTGWFKAWGSPDPYRTAEDLAFSVARFFQLGGTFQNYYMYHGGTNFGRNAGGPYIATTYDYNAPLNEYGELNQPKYGHLKQLHDLLHSLEHSLTNGEVLHQDLDQSKSVTATIYTTTEGVSCFLSNTNNATDANVKFRGLNYLVPAWSVSILPDCGKEVYNTAKVSAQTSVYVKKPAADEGALKWEWLPEKFQNITLSGKGDTILNKIVDHKEIANDTSDYLWYMTSYSVEKNDPLLSGSANATLRVNDTGAVLHAYVNGEYIGSKWGPAQYDFEGKINLKPGNNTIALLSASVGFPNYGPGYDLFNVGILSPVQLASDGKVVADLSTHLWSYKVGLDGFSNEIFGTECSSSNWISDNLSTNRKMTWYKTTFEAPVGEEPVVVDLLGLGKGEAWVNGNSLGRYWPSFIADKNACQTKACNYRGTYHSEKCTSKCGEPTQRWYHVPRSFLIEGDNTLVLFEEFGGDPKDVKFETVEVGKACVNANVGDKVELSCNNRPISKISFASYGDPIGECGAFKESEECPSYPHVLPIIEKECVGKESCSFQISEKKFGFSSCGKSRLAVEAIC